MIWLSPGGQGCKIHPWAPPTVGRAEGTGRGRGGVLPLKTGVRGSASSMPPLHALRPEASADYLKKQTSYASEYLTPLMAWPNWYNMVCLLLLLLCFLVSAAGPPPLWFASSRRSAVPFPSLSLSLSRELALYLHMCSIAQYVSTMGTVSVNI